MHLISISLTGTPQTKTLLKINVILTFYSEVLSVTTNVQLSDTGGNMAWNGLNMNTA